MNFKRNALTTAILATSLTSGVAMAQDPNPYMRPDDTWISINGTVQDITRNSFGLNYGDGVVIVEMDDGDRDVCKICLVNKIDTVLVPCGHRCICDSCSKGLGSRKACPICRKAIQ